MIQDIIIYDLIIIGGGPAGIAAGIYAARKKLKTLLIARDFIGQAGKAVVVDNYPGIEEISGAELMGKFKKHLEKFEIDIREGKPVREIRKEEGVFEVTIPKENKYLAKAVIIASGRDPRPLKVLGEKEFLGKGVSYCATCDGILFKGKTVAVIGGGNAGFYSALELAKYCPKVYIFEGGEVVRADEIVQEMVRKTGKTEVICNVEISEIRGRDFVSSLIYKNRASGKIGEIPVKGIIIEIGSIPATSFVKDLVDFTERGEIRIDLRTGATKTLGLFAAGDVTEVRDKQIIIAAAEGTKALLSAYNYLQAL